MGTSFTGEVSSDRLTSCPGDGENHLSAKRHRNRILAPTLWALWPKKTTVTHPSTNQGRSCLTPAYQEVGRNGMPIDWCTIPQGASSGDQDHYLDMKLLGHLTCNLKNLTKLPYLQCYLTNKLHMACFVSMTMYKAKRSFQWFRWCWPWPNIKVTGQGQGFLSKT